MSSPIASPDPETPALAPELLAIIEALAEAQARRDYAAQHREPEREH